MSLLLALLTVIALIVWSTMRRPKQAPQPVLVRRYVHPGHTWMRETEDGDVLVGIDEFAQSLIGRVDDVVLPRLLKKVKQGSPAWVVKHGGRVVPMVSPVTGRVIEKNEMVLRDPRLINTSPYGDGWLLRIRPAKLHVHLNNVFTGRAAQQWLEQSRQRLVRMLGGTSALMYQDGGELLHDVCDRLSEEEWQNIAREFFLTDCETAITSSSNDGAL